MILEKRMRSRTPTDSARRPAARASEKCPSASAGSHANGCLSVTLACREQRIQSRSIGGDLGKVYLGPRCFPQRFVVVRVGVDGPYEVLERVFLAAFLVGGIAQRNELGRRLSRYRRGHDGEGHRETSQPPTFHDYRALISFVFIRKYTLTASNATPLNAMTFGAELTLAK